MEHGLLGNLARDRQAHLLALAEAERDGYRARRHSRIARRAERADRRLASHWDQAARLQAHLRDLESTS